MKEREYKNLFIIGAAKAGTTFLYDQLIQHPQLTGADSNNPNKMKRITMYITRIGQDGELRESAPCHDCYEKMLFYGIKTIIFTTENQDTTDVEIVKYNIEDFNPSVVTTGQRFMLKTKNNEMSQ
mgnify:CR=1 FL=1